MAALEGLAVVDNLVQQRWLYPLTNLLHHNRHMDTRDLTQVFVVLGYSRGFLQPLLLYIPLLDTLLLLWLQGKMRLL